VSVPQFWAAIGKKDQEGPSLSPFSLVVPQGFGSWLWLSHHSYCIAIFDSEGFNRADKAGQPWLKKRIGIISIYFEYFFPSPFASSVSPAKMSELPSGSF
jgi:hypothetical protein